MGELILLRHGETEWSRELRHTGRTDVPLTDAGEAAATALAPGARRPATCAPCSPAPLSAPCGPPRLAGLTGVKEDPDLWEWDYGGYEGRTTADIRTERPGWYLWRDGVMPGDADHPGETMAQVARGRTRCSAGCGRCSRTGMSSSSPMVTCCAC